MASPTGVYAVDVLLWAGPGVGLPPLVETDNPEGNALLLPLCVLYDVQYSSTVQTISLRAVWLQVLTPANQERTV